MKKSLIALAVLGTFAGAAAAQSTATLYGKMDVGYGVGNAGAYENTKGNASKFQQWGNSNSTSRWGLKGSEDLGNGLKVYFKLESKIDPEDGSQGDAKLFDRAAFVGITGAFGSVQIGRQNTVMNNVLGQFSVSGDPNLTSALGNAGISAIAQRLGGPTYSRINSGLAYVSPNWNGFNFQAALVLKNDESGAGNIDDKNIYTVGAYYTYGGLTVGGAFESKPNGAKDMSSSWGLGAKYDFGSFLISGGYTDNHRKDDGRGFYLGASAPIGAFEVGAQIAYNTKIPGDDVAIMEDQWNWWTNSMDQVQVGTREEGKLKPLAWELFAKYNLSKRTQLYIQYGGINNDAKDFQGAERKYSASLGLIHNF